MKQQSGSALLLSLMVLALVSGIATSLLMSVQNEQSVIARIQMNSDVRQQLLGGEAWAQDWLIKEGLVQDISSGNSFAVIPTSSLVVHQVFETEAGSLDISLFDLQACININRLANTNSVEITKQRLTKLSEYIGIDKGWISVAQDWLDNDQNLASGQGREDAFYLSKEEPYRTSRSLILSGTEWSLLDIPQASIALLAPYICVLPESMGVNINRAPDMLVKSYLPTINTEQLTALNDIRAVGGFDALDDFIEDDAFKSLKLEEQDWSINTRFISVFSKLTTEDGEYWLHSQLSRDKDNKVKAFYRSFAPLDFYSKVKMNIESGM
ncbi:type II secretion system minor pseudopilin GspK [Marinomonas transparens]|uniref:Type II secretion system protein K n=1 Tax=Marinomonas transparens TaxID=2795388 RepID=A0A934JMQ6_9GAMM|nr:type II secretion system minor pseudopilin GspK [Marinomonas transparens]MBJ7539055.1 type II secretion system minor pseudopilin GspK [Marinomonas transparens]